MVLRLVILLRSRISVDLLVTNILSQLGNYLNRVICRKNDGSRFRNLGRFFWQKLSGLQAFFWLSGGSLLFHPQEITNLTLNFGLLEATSGGTCKILLLLALAVIPLAICHSIFITTTILLLSIIEIIQTFKIIICYHLIDLRLLNPNLSLSINIKRGMLRRWYRILKMHTFLHIGVTRVHWGLLVQSFLNRLG